MIEIGSNFIRRAKSWFPFIFLLVFFFFSWVHFENRIVSLCYFDSEAIERTLFLPKKERDRLLGLMESLFSEDTFAYTLIGAKPISWATYQTPLPYVNLPTSYRAIKKNNRRMLLGWKTWEKYAYLFSENIFFSENSPHNPNSISIFLINKDKFDSIVKNNRNDFEIILGKQIESGAQLLQEATNRSLVNDVFKRHQALLGIALGYGKENSWQFCQKCRENKALDWVWTEREYWDPEMDVTQFSSTAIRNFYLYSCPSFSGNPDSEESLQLKQSYLQARKKILSYYQDKDFLEATLSLLAGYPIG